MSDNPVANAAVNLHLLRFLTEHEFDPECGCNDCWDEAIDRADDLAEHALIRRDDAERGR